MHPQAYCFHGVLRVDSSAIGLREDPIELEKRGITLAQSGNVQEAIKTLQAAARLFRIQAKMIDYRRVQSALDQLRQ